jgi:multisubunit Na+/H+ antiporter MnhE subunit
MRCLETMRILRKIGIFGVLFGSYLWNFVWSNIMLAKQILAPRVKVEPGMIVISSKVEKPMEILSLANMISFTPGTLTVDVDPGKTITVHALNDPERASREIPRDLEGPLLKITRRDDA